MESRAEIVRATVKMLAKGLAERFESVYLNEDVVRIAKRLLHCCVRTTCRIEKLEWRDYSIEFTVASEHVRVRGLIVFAYEISKARTKVIYVKLKARISKKLPTEEVIQKLLDYTNSVKELLLFSSTIYAISKNFISLKLQI